MQDPDYRTMARQFDELGITTAFPQVHHFASTHFASRPPTLSRFVSYCDAIDDFNEGENPQIIRRGLALCAYVRQGDPLQTAISRAWEAFHLVTR